MASPVPVTTSRLFIAAAGSHVLTNPSGTTPGDLLLAIVTTVSNIETLSPSAGWSTIAYIDGGATPNANCEPMAIYGRVADGGANDTLTVTMGGSSNITYVMYRITGGSLADILTSGIVFQTGSTTPDPPSVNIAGAPNDALIITAFGKNTFVGEGHANTAPSGYSGLLTDTVPLFNLGEELNCAHKQVTAATTEDPGTFGIANGSGFLTMVTISIPEPFAAPPSADGGQPAVFFMG